MAAELVILPQAGDEVTATWGQSVAKAHNGIQAGAGTIPAAAASVSSLAVTFPRAYTAAPIVTASAVSASGFWIIAVGSITATGCILYSSRRDGSNVSAIVANWVAIGTPA